MRSNYSNVRQYGRPKATAARPPRVNTKRKQKAQHRVLQVLQVDKPSAGCIERAPAVSSAQVLGRICSSGFRNIHALHRFILQTGASSDIRQIWVRRGPLAKCSVWPRMDHPHCSNTAALAWGLAAGWRLAQGWNLRIWCAGRRILLTNVGATGSSASLSSMQGLTSLAHINGKTRNCIETCTVPRVAHTALSRVPFFKR
jgi:hypothetical protein